MCAAESHRVEYPDDDIQFRVSSFLGSRQFGEISKLQVAVQNGTVTLHGTVGSFYEKQVALNSCRRVAGVLSMVDEIRVDTTPIAGQRPLSAGSGLAIPPALPRLPR